MGRSRVPAALHSELSEYSSLLRALRTTNTLDIATQLTKPLPIASTERETVTRDPSPADSQLTRKRKRRGGGEPGSNKQKDYWTRWPLLLGDVHVPEWGIEDEVKFLASQGSNLRSSAHTPDGGGDDEEMHFQPFLDALTISSSTHLAHILSLVAAHVPLAAKSMQDRYSPIGWENVLDIVSASGVVDEKIVQNVQRRMEAIHGASQSFSVAVHRLRGSAIAKRKFKDSMAGYEMSFLSFPEAPRDTKKPRKTKAKKAKPGP